MEPPTPAKSPRLGTFGGRKFISTPDGTNTARPKSSQSNSMLNNQSKSNVSQSKSMLNNQSRSNVKSTVSLTQSAKKTITFYKC